MARQQEVGVKVTADTKQAEQNLSRFQRTLGNVRKGFVALRAAIVATVAIVAAFVLAIGRAIGAASQQEQAVQNLNAALGELGGQSQRVSEALQQQAAALQQVTRFGDEQIIQAQALLATLGVTAEQLPEATRATVNLAESFGVDLQQAARNVGRTVGGFAGELGELVPELRNLSTEALQSGEGIRLLAERFAGRAQAGAATFSGRVARLSNAFGDLIEAFGGAFTGSSRFGVALDRLTQLIVRITPAAVRFGTILIEVVLGTVEKLSNAVSFLLRPLRALFRLFGDGERAAWGYEEAQTKAAESVETATDKAEAFIRALGLQNEEQRKAASQTDETTEALVQETQQVEALTVATERFIDVRRQEIEIEREFVGVIESSVAARGDFARQAAERRSGVNFQGSSIGRRIGTNDPIFGGLSGGAFSVSRTRVVANPDGTVSFV